MLLYIASQGKSLGALMAQENEKGKEKALYYLSRTLNGAELNYGKDLSRSFLCHRQTRALHASIYGPFDSKDRPD